MGLDPQKTTLGKGLDSYGLNIHLSIQIVIVGKFLEKSPKNLNLLGNFCENCAPHP